MFTIDDYTNSIKINLEKNSNKLISNISKIVDYNFFTEIDILDFVASIEPTRFELSIRMFSMDKVANEVFYEEDDNKVFAGSIDVLQDIEYYHLSDSQFDEFLDFYEENEDEIYDKEQRVFTNWFYNCWIKAGGQNFKLPSYFVFHDDDKSFNLKENKWISDDNKWE